MGNKISSILFKFTTSILVLISYSSAAVAFSINENIDHKDNNNISIGDKKQFSPYLTTTITSKTIERSGATTIAEAIQLIPGMVKSRPFGSYEVLSYGGLQDEYPRAVRIEVNGVPVNLASTGSVFWESMPISIEDVQSITFVSTPSSAVNGEQAFNGIIKINTFSADEQSNAISASIGKNSYRRSYARVAHDITDKLSVQGSFSREQGDGRIDKTSSEERNRIWLNALYKKDLNNRFSMNYGIGQSHDDRDLDGDLPYQSYRDRKIESQVLDVTWVNTLNGRLQVTLGVVSANNYIYNNIYDTLLFDINYDSLRTFSSIDYNKSVSDATQIEASFNLRKDHETPRKFSRSDKYWDTQTVDMSLGLVHGLCEDSELSLHGSVHTHTLFEDQSNISLSYLTRLDSNQAVSILYSQGFRYPVNWESQSEHYLTLLSNPEVQLVRNNNNPSKINPEKVNSLTLKYEHFKNYDDKISAGLFYKSYSDLIYQVFEPYSDGVGLYNGNVLNRGYGEEIDVVGLELYSVKPLSRWTSASIAYTYNHDIIPHDNRTDLKNSVPDHVLALSIDTEVGKWSIGGAYHYVSKLNWIIDDSEEEEKITKPYQTINLHAKNCSLVSEGLDELCVTAFVKNATGPVSTFFNTDYVKTVKESVYVGLKAEYRF